MMILWDLCGDIMRIWLEYGHVFASLPTFLHLYPAHSWPVTMKPALLKTSWTSTSWPVTSTAKNNCQIWTIVDLENQQLCNKINNPEYQRHQHGDWSLSAVKSNIVQNCAQHRCRKLHRMTVVMVVVPDSGTLVASLTSAIQAPELSDRLASQKNNL